MGAAPPVAVAAAPAKPSAPSAPAAPAAGVPLAGIPLGARSSRSKKSRGSRHGRSRSANESRSRRKKGNPGDLAPAEYDVELVPLSGPTGNAPDATGPASSGRRPSPIILILGIVLLLGGVIGLAALMGSNGLGPMWQRLTGGPTTTEPASNP
jgi:hypothetical protein